MSCVPAAVAAAALVLGACSTEMAAGENPESTRPPNSADSVLDTDDSEEADDHSLQLLGDVVFRDGFLTFPATPTVEPTGLIAPPNAMHEPIWKLQEWHTGSLLANTPPEATALGSQWANSKKRVVVNESWLELAINSEAEYGGVYRKDGEAWPHLLIAQGIYDNVAPSQQVALHDYERIVLEMTIELAYAEHIREMGYSSGIHACQFLMFVTVQNRNPDHPDYGNFIWIGLPLYDSREAYVEEWTSVETGVGKHIFRMATQDFMSASLHEQSTVSISVDLAPYMREKLEVAIDQGILQSGDLSDYHLGGMNLGWEVPGRSIATMRVRDLSLVGTAP